MKTRFAPSPTGLIHLGNARTALFSALYAASLKGTFLLRIEDTDKARSTSEYITSLCRDLSWLGIEWQEGEMKGGVYSPYRQSERANLYVRYYDQLIQQGRAYFCFCSEAELSLERKLQQAANRPPRYSGKCKHLTELERTEKIRQGFRPALRFSVGSESIEFSDLVKGRQHYKAVDIGDFIIRRHDEGSSFMFCNVIDDSLMGVTHVLRGEDHLTNTPRQLMIARALQLREPQYGHMALINGSDGAPLSKRNGSRSIQELRERGFLPLAVINYMARLGHYYEQNSLLDWNELAQYFSLHRLGLAAARFDETQLLFWQRSAVQSLNDQDFQNWIKLELAHVPFQFHTAFIETVRENINFPLDVAHYAHLFFNPHFSVSHNLDVLTQAGPAFFDTALQGLELYGIDFKAIGRFLTENLNVTGKNLFQPIRVALTGELHGPQLQKMMELIGLEIIRDRLKRAGAMQ